MKHAKSYARERAVKGLYQINISNDTDLDKFKDPLAKNIVNSIKDDEENINSYIKKYLKRWSISQLNPVNLAIMQVAVYEMLQTDLDAKIIISQALNLANDYSEKKDKNFIHFVLDSINKDING